MIPCLTVVGDASDASVAIMPQRAISSCPLIPMLKRFLFTRGLFKMIRTERGARLCGITARHAAAKRRCPALTPVSS
jgi:hypothetical protein